MLQDLFISPPQAATKIRRLIVSTFDEQGAIARPMEMEIMVHGHAAHHPLALGSRAIGASPSVHLTPAFEGGLINTFDPVFSHLIMSAFRELSTLTEAFGPV